MPLAETAGWPTWLAATSITVLVWWTIASPIAVLGVAVLGARRPRTAYLLTVAVCTPPLLVLLPLTVMRGGAGAAAAGARGGARDRRRRAWHWPRWSTYRRPAAAPAGRAGRDRGPRRRAT